MNTKNLIINNLKKPKYSLIDKVNSANGADYSKLTAARARKSNTLQQYFQAFVLPYFVWHSSVEKIISSNI